MSDGGWRPSLVSATGRRILGLSVERELGLCQSGELSFSGDFVCIRLRGGGRRQGARSLAGQFHS